MNPERAGDDFGAIALKLAGLAGWQLGWSADRYWNATPAEMETVVRAMLGADGAAGAETPPTRGEIARLMEIYPDG